MSRIAVLQHSPCEHLGIIGPVLTSRGLDCDYRHTYAGDPVPEDLDPYAALIVMGGPMGVYEEDEYPFLRDEIALLNSALREEVPVLGICLGSQLLAAALGAAVGPGKGKEIGWHRIELTEQGSSEAFLGAGERGLTAFHWHGDVFDCPKNALNLATSERTPCQAFRYRESVYGILFHMEITMPMIGEWVGAFAAELGEEGLDGGQIASVAGNYLADLQERGRTFFERWADAVGVGGQV